MQMYKGEKSHRELYIVLKLHLGLYIILMHNTQSFCPECNLITWKEWKCVVQQAVSVSFQYVKYAVSGVTVRWLSWTLKNIPHFDPEQWSVPCCFKWALWNRFIFMSTVPELNRYMWIWPFVFSWLVNFTSKISPFVCIFFIGIALLTGDIVDTGAIINHCYDLCLVLWTMTCFIAYTIICSSIICSSIEFC